MRRPSLVRVKVHRWAGPSHLKILDLAVWTRNTPWGERLAACRRQNGELGAQSACNASSLVQDPFGEAIPKRWPHWGLGCIPSRGPQASRSPFGRDEMLRFSLNQMPVPFGWIIEINCGAAKLLAIMKPCAGVVLSCFGIMDQSHGPPAVPHGNSPGFGTSVPLGSTMCTNASMSMTRPQQMHHAQSSTNLNHCDAQQAAIYAMSKPSSVQAHRQAQAWALQAHAQSWAPPAAQGAFLSGPAVSNGSLGFGHRTNVPQPPRVDQTNVPQDAASTAPAPPSGSGSQMGASFHSDGDPYGLF